jgi:hypothetical protein
MNTTGVTSGTGTAYHYHHIQKSLKIPKGQSESYTSIEEEQTTQWPKGKVQKDKKRSTKYTHKTKNRVIRTKLLN